MILEHAFQAALLAASLGLGAFCMILSRRLRRLNDLETGLGGAIVVNGELVLGAWGVAAEVGHMRVVPGGHYCGCGHEGCWEQYASGSALVRDVARGFVARGAEPELGPARRVGVVRHDDLHLVADLLGDDVPQRVLAPRQVRGEQHGGLVGADEAGGGEADRADLVLLGELLARLDDAPVDARGVAGVGVATGLRDDPAVLVDHTGGDLRPADVHTDGVHASLLPREISAWRTREDRRTGTLHRCRGGDTARVRPHASVLGGLLCTRSQRPGGSSAGTGAGHPLGGRVGRRDRDESPLCS